MKTPKKEKCFIADNPQPRLVPAYPYLLGAYLGDGSITKTPGHYQFRLAVIDQDFAENVARAIEVIKGKKPVIRNLPPVGYGKKDRFQVEAYGKQFLNRLREETQNKQSLPNMSGWDKQDKLAFIAGLMDSEGYVSRGVRKNGGIQYQTGFTTCDIWLNHFINLLKSLGVKVGKAQNKLGNPKHPLKRPATEHRFNSKSFIESGCYFTIERKQSRLNDYTLAPYY